MGTTATRAAARVLGDRVRELREAKGWSQAELARKARMERAHLTRIEGGHGGDHGVGLSIIVRLASALEVIPARLLALDNKDAA